MKRLLALFAGCLLATMSFAYETDQLTARESVMRDADALADARLDQILADVVARTNEDSGCGLPDDVLRDRVAQRIHKGTSAKLRVPRRPYPRSMGFDIYSAYLETAEVDRIPFDEREDIYRGVRMGTSVILRAVGPSSTIQLSGVRLGTDKLQHFLSTGHTYYRLAARHDEERAVRWGTFTERTWLGLYTSKAFSYADLHANWEGMRFYQGLLAPGSVIQRGADGCLVQAAPFHWSDWIDPNYDEVVNPNVYTRRVQRLIDRELDGRTVLCESYRHWTTDGYVDGMGRLGELMPGEVGLRSPVRSDPFRLAERCSAVPIDTLANAPEGD